MTVATAPRNLMVTMELLEDRLTENGQIHEFHAMNGGGGFWSLISRTDTGTWALTEDNTLCWYPGETWLEDGAEATSEDYLDPEENEDPAEIAEAAFALITLRASATAAADLGRAHGTLAAKHAPETPHFLVVENAAAAASIVYPNALVAYSQAYIDGFYSVITAK